MLLIEEKGKNIIIVTLYINLWKLIINAWKIVTKIKYWYRNKLYEWALSEKLTVNGSRWAEEASHTFHKNV